jgi:hypothetical protein
MKVTCKTCNGSGLVDFNGAQADTLIALRAQNS